MKGFFFFFFFKECYGVPVLEKAIEISSSKVTIFINKGRSRTESTHSHTKTTFLWFLNYDSHSSSTQYYIFQWFQLYFMTRMQYFNKHYCWNNDRPNKRQLIVLSNVKFKKILVEPKLMKHRSWVTLFIQQKDSLPDCFKVPSICAGLKIWFNLNLIFLECIYLKIQGTSLLYFVDWYRVA